MKRLALGAMCVAMLAWARPVLADDRPELAGGKTFSIKFPEMPPTFYEQATKDHKTPMMTVFLPSNYDPQRKHPCWSSSKVSTVEQQRVRAGHAIWRRRRITSVSRCPCSK